MSCGLATDARTVGAASGGREISLTLVGGSVLVRGVLASLLDAQPGIRVACAVASIDALEALCRAGTPRCDVALVDIDDHSSGCAPAVDRLLALRLPGKLVLLCSEPSDELLRCAVERGVDGVVLKRSSVRELQDALSHILSGHAVLPSGRRPASSLTSLTPRQYDVLTLMSCGHSNKEIAAALGLRRNTVKVHISEIFRRLGVRNRVEAIGRLDAPERPVV
jgi:DNA-binding NarL/FixJ family response regulator